MDRTELLVAPLIGASDTPRFRGVGGLVDRPSPCGCHPPSMAILASGSASSGTPAGPHRTPRPTVYLFPGQGDQPLGPSARDDVERWRPDLFEALLDLLGEDPFEAGYYSAPGLRQPALFCTTVARWTRMQALDLISDEIAGMAGHSLGELGALVAADALAPQDGVFLARRRGQLIEQAMKRSPAGGMLAIRRVDATLAAELADRCGVEVASDSAPDHTVLAGALPALELARTEARRRGLEVADFRLNGAFRSPAMVRAAASFEHAVREVPFRAPRVPVLSCVTAEPFGDPATCLSAAFTHSVRWRQTIERLCSAGARRFVDVGPGAALADVVTRLLPEMAVPVGGHADIASAGWR